jgi:organic radical activating enzyme
VASTGLPERRRIRRQALQVFRDSGQAVFKFVIASDADLAELHALERELELRPVWVMPEGRTRADVLEAMARLSQTAVAHRWNLACRLHTLLWEDERGR